jgi:hypothetical protein
MFRGYFDETLKIRSMMMKNLVKCVVGFFVMLWAKSQMLKWGNHANEGGGGSMEWRVKNG